MREMRENDSSFFIMLFVLSVVFSLVTANLVATTAAVYAKNGSSGSSDHGSSGSSNNPPSPPDNPPKRVIAHFYDSKGNNVGGGLYQAAVNPGVLKSLQSGVFNIKANTSVMKGTPSFLRLEYQSITS